MTNKTDLNFKSKYSLNKIFFKNKTPVGFSVCHNHLLKFENKFSYHSKRLTIIKKKQNIFLFLKYKFRFNNI